MKRWQRAVIFSAFIAMTVAMMVLFYNQSVGNYPSDLAMHIKYAVSGEYQYSLTGALYKTIVNHVGGYWGIAVLLTIVSLCNTCITKKVLKFYLKEDNSFIQWMYAILLNFVIAIYIPFIYKKWVVGMQEPTEWHNSTYICMKPIALITMILYFDIEKTYLKKINWRKYVLFCIVLTLVNSIKPNFIVCFAPAMLVFLIVDFIKNYKDFNAIKNMIVFGGAVIISLPVLFYQQSVLYAEGSGSGIEFAFLKVLKIYNDKPIISLIQSAAFPIYIIATNFKDVLKERKHSFVLVMNSVALVEYLCLAETGTRAAAGNWAWGYSFTLMMAFISATAILNNKEKSKHSVVYYTLAYALLGLHILSGLIYFVRLVCGCHYA